MTGGAGRLWVLFCLAMGLAAVAAWFVPTQWLDWQPQAAAGEPWRWWSAAWVHWSGMHLLANLFGLVLVAALGRVSGVPGMLALAWVASWPLTHLGLLMHDELRHYGGLSGVLHGGVAVVAVYLVGRGSGRTRTIGWAVLAGLAAKVLLEVPWGPPLRQLWGADIPIAPLAHATGALSGLVCAGLVLAREAQHDEIEQPANE